MPPRRLPAGRSITTSPTQRRRFHFASFHPRGSEKATNIRDREISRSVNEHAGVSILPINTPLNTGGSYYDFSGARLRISRMAAYRLRRRYEISRRELYRRWTRDWTLHEIKSLLECVCAQCQLGLIIARIKPSANISQWVAGEQVLDGIRRCGAFPSRNFASTITLRTPSNLKEQREESRDAMLHKLSFCFDATNDYFTASSPPQICLNI